MKRDNDTTEVQLVTSMVSTIAEKCPESWERFKSFQGDNQWAINLISG